MADNVLLPATGTGTASVTQATDDVSGIHYPVVKLADGTADSTTRVVYDANAGFLVRPSPKLVRITVTPTGSTSAYGSGDCYGGLQDIANAVRSSVLTGTLLSVLVLDIDNDRSAMDLVFYDRSVTVAGDNAAFAPSDADMLNCLGVIPIGPYNTAWPGTPPNAISSLYNVGLPIVCNGTSLYCQAVLRATPTKTGTTDLKFIYTILQD